MKIPDNGGFNESNPVGCTEIIFLCRATIFEATYSIF